MKSVRIIWKYEFFQPFFSPTLPGAHQVASKTVKDFYINVCREISGEVSPGKKCPEGSSSCVESKDKGHIVQFTSLSLVNDYTINLKYANPSNGSSTNITFVCPKSILQPVSFSRI